VCNLQYLCNFRSQKDPVKQNGFFTSLHTFLTIDRTCRATFCSNKLNIYSLVLPRTKCIFCQYCFALICRVFAGFDGSSIVEIGSSSCRILGFEYSKIICETRASSTEDIVNVKVTTNGIETTLANSYHYKASEASISSVSPTSLSVAGGKRFCN